VHPMGSVIKTQIDDTKPAHSHPVRGSVRVVHLTTGHLSDDIRIFWKECVSLARAGYEVLLVAPDDGPPRRAGPDGCVEIVPVRLRPSRFGRLALAPLSVVAAGLRCNAMLYHFHDSNFLLYGLLLRLLGRRVVYDVHEDVPRDIHGKPWIPRILRPPTAWLAGAVEWVAGHAMSGVAAATPVIARRFPPRRTALVQNFAELAEFALGGPSSSRSHSITYIGSISRERGALELVEVLEHLPQFPDVRLILAGAMFPPALGVELATKPEWQRVDYRGWQDRRGVRGVLSEARVGLVLFHPLQAHIDSQPNKLFEYMSAGLPVIASDFPGFRAVVEANGCGLCVPPLDISAIATAIAWIFEHPQEADEMGRRGRDLVERAFNWDREVGALLRLYEVALGQVGSVQEAAG
jgi:glycosyltransferase involved in cell wall biosynthesis